MALCQMPFDAACEFLPLSQLVRCWTCPQRSGWPVTLVFPVNVCSRRAWQLATNTSSAPWLASNSGLQREYLSLESLMMVTDTPSALWLASNSGLLSGRLSLACLTTCH
jgi:hypothetical protein